MHEVPLTLRPQTSPQVCDATRYHAPELARESLVIFLVSTFGHNQPPYSGAALKAFVKDPRTKLPGLFYTVFALGNSVYPSFCSFGKLFDKRLTDVGARRLMPITLCDEVSCSYNVSNWRKLSPTLQTLKFLGTHLRLVNILATAAL